MGIKLEARPVIYSYRFNSRKAIERLENLGFEVDYEKVNGYNKMIYVGSTINEKNRYNQHRYNKHGKTKFARFCKKYGFESFDYTVLHVFDPMVETQEIREKEQYFLDIMQPFDNKGFNLQRKTILSAVDIEKLLANNNYKSIVKIDMETHEVLEIYRSLSEASKHNNTTVSTLSAILDNRVNSSGGFYWLGLDDLFDLYGNELDIGMIVDGFLLPYNNTVTKEPICVFNRYHELEMIFGSKQLTCEFGKITSFMLNKRIQDLGLHKNRHYFIRQSDLKELTERHIEVNKTYEVDFKKPINKHANRICVFNKKNILVGVYKNKTQASEILKISLPTINKYLFSGELYKNKHRFIEYDKFITHIEGLPLVGKFYKKEINICLTPPA